MENIHIKIQDALKHVKPTLNSNMYLIKNSDGLIFSSDKGWHDLNDKLNGHCFDFNEVQVIVKILEEHGYTDIKIEKDKTATNFIRAANSPFGNPVKMIKLLFGTALFFLLLFILIKSGLVDMLLLNDVEK